MAFTHWTTADHNASLTASSIAEPYKVFSLDGGKAPTGEQKNDSGLDFDVGNRVGVKTRPLLGAGTIRWRGQVAGFEEDWVGIELELPRGKTDGMIKGVRHFSCDPKHGIYSPVSEIDWPKNIKDLSESQPKDPPKKKNAQCFICTVM